MFGSIVYSLEVRRSGQLKNNKSPMALSAGSINVLVFSTDNLKVVTNAPEDVSSPLSKVVNPSSVANWPSNRESLP